VHSCLLPSFDEMGSEFLDRIHIKLIHQGIAGYEIDCCTAETSSSAVEQTTAIAYHAEAVPVPLPLGFSIAFFEAAFFMKSLHLLQRLHPLKIKDSTRGSAAKLL